MMHETLVVGATFQHDGITVTILRSGEPRQDRFGRTLTGYWSRREDTGEEGFMTYGPGGVA